MRPSIGTNGKGRHYIKSMVVNAGRVIEIDGWSSRPMALSRRYNIMKLKGDAI